MGGVTTNPFPFELITFILAIVDSLKYVCLFYNKKAQGGDFRGHIPSNAHILKDGFI
jgi:hypothetical protein